MVANSTILLKKRKRCWCVPYLHPTQSKFRRHQKNKRVNLYNMIQQDVRGQLLGQ